MENESSIIIDPETGDEAMMAEPPFQISDSALFSGSLPETEITQYLRDLQTNSACILIAPKSWKQGESLQFPVYVSDKSNPVENWLMEPANYGHLVAVNEASGEILIRKMNTFEGKLPLPGEPPPIKPPPKNEPIRNWHYSHDRVLLSTEVFHSSSPEWKIFLHYGMAFSNLHRLQALPKEKPKSPTAFEKKVLTTVSPSSSPAAPDPRFGRHPRTPEIVPGKKPFAFRLEWTREPYPYLHLAFAEPPSAQAPFTHFPLHLLFSNAEVPDLEVKTLFIPASFLEKSGQGLKGQVRISLGELFGTDYPIEKFPESYWITPVTRSQVGSAVRLPLRRPVPNTPR